MLHRKPHLLLKLKQHFHVKLKAADGTSPLSRTYADIAKSTRERPAQKLGPKIINLMISSFVVHIPENRLWALLIFTVSGHLDTSRKVGPKVGRRIYPFCLYRFCDIPSAS
jgi:hypothetical protein